MKYPVTISSYLLTVFLSVLLFSACARKTVFEKSIVVPSASGKVKVKKDNNNNYSIDVDVKDLTPPENLTPPQKAYIVWNETSSGVFNIGQLNTSRSLLARGYKASINAVSANKPNRVFITAEDNTNTLYPGPLVVLTTPNF